MKLYLNNHLRDMVNKYEPANSGENAIRLSNLTDENRQWLILHNLKFVLSTITNHSDIRLKHDDIFLQGVIGLIKAIDEFDPEKGCTLTTYAAPKIRHEVNRLMSKSITIVKFPTTITETSVLSKMKKMVAKNPEMEISDVIKNIKNDNPQYESINDDLMEMFFTYFELDIYSHVPIEDDVDSLGLGFESEYETSLRNAILSRRSEIDDELIDAINIDENLHTYEIFNDE